MVDLGPLNPGPICLDCGAGSPAHNRGCSHKEPCIICRHVGEGEDDVVPFGLTGKWVCEHETACRYRTWAEEQKRILGRVPREDGTRT